MSCVKEVHQLGFYLYCEIHVGNTEIDGIAAVQSFTHWFDVLQGR